MSIKSFSRRTFLKLAGAGIVALSFTKPSFAGDSTKTNFFETDIGKARLKLIQARQAGQYKDDKIVREKFDIAASHKNPMIKRFYSEFARHPLSEISEALLHTHYKARV